MCAGGSAGIARPTSGAGGFLLGFAVALGGGQTKLVAHHAGAQLFDLAFLQRAKLERPVRDPQQAVHRVADLFHGAANFAVLAFAQPDGEPCISALLTIKVHGHRLEAFAVDHHAFAQHIEFMVLRSAIDAHPVAAQPASGGQLQLAFDAAVVGQQQQTFGIEVETPDRHHPRQILGQFVKDRPAAFFVRIGRHQTGGFVVEPQARGLGLGQGGAIHHDAITAGHVERRAVDHRAVDRNAALGNHPLRLTARGHTGAREHLGNAVALRRGPRVPCCACLRGFGIARLR